MTWKDKMELGLKEDAPFREDNLPDFQKEGAKKRPAGPGRSPEVPRARHEANRARKATRPRATVVRRRKRPRTALRKKAR